MPPKAGSLRHGAAVASELPGDEAAVAVRGAADDDLQLIGVVQYRYQAFGVVAQGEALGQVATAH